MWSWSMREDEDIDGLAAEYVLGSLDPRERREVEERCKRDRQLVATIAAWERRLSPLSQYVPEEAPPAHVWEGILARVSQQTANPRHPAHGIMLRQRPRRRWAIAGTGVVALAASLALAVGSLYHTQPSMHLPARIDCGDAYKSIWTSFERGKYASISAEHLAGVSRMALRAYDACQAGDEQDAKALYYRLRSQVDRGQR